MSCMVLPSHTGEFEKAVAVGGTQSAEALGAHTPKFNVATISNTHASSEAMSKRTGQFFWRYSFTVLSVLDAFADPADCV